MFDWTVPLGMLITVLITVIGTVWSLAWWLSHQFSKIRDLVYSKIDLLETAITAKLEYHERHDDQRFNNMRNDIFDLRIRNAAQDGYKPIIKDKD